MRKALVILLLGGAGFLSWPGVAAPAAPEVPADSPLYGVYPIAYRDIVMKFLESRLLDAGSARIEWGQPAPGTIKTRNGNVSGYAVVVTVNARNKFGMYTGKQKYRIFIRNGDVVHAGRG
ncbi:MAG TPA: hypothetical protein VK474_09535 [Chthoniobacterales bacterium]|nr:hypothetical protein [Chthoniobacterales bacterium]